MRTMLTVVGAGAVALLDAVVGSQNARAAVGQTGLTPVPCATRAWENDDASFEALPGAKASFGQYEGGVYRIEVPDNWNGDLVLWAHGFVTDAGARGLHLRPTFPGGGQGPGPSLRDYLDYTRVRVGDVELPVQRLRARRRTARHDGPRRHRHEDRRPGAGAHVSHRRVNGRSHHAARHAGVPRAFCRRPGDVSGGSGRDRLSSYSRRRGR